MLWYSISAIELVLGYNCTCWKTNWNRTGKEMGSGRIYEATFIGKKLLSILYKKVGIESVGREFDR